jgi:hypothetical protein
MRRPAGSGESVGQLNGHMREQAKHNLHLSARPGYSTYRVAACRRALQASEQDASVSNNVESSREGQRVAAVF